ncbi:MAG: conserved hypothetical protein [Methanobrevibacter sp. CfCl-M3]
MHAGSYNVSAIFNGDVDYNPSTSNTTFNVDKKNTSLSLTVANITYGDNASISATLTDSNGTLLSSRAIIFNINGNNYTAMTNGSGVAVFINISGLHAGSYNVSVSFNGDVDYNPSTNNITFNIGKRDTSLSIVKTVNSTDPVVVGDLVNYTIKVMNNGANNISTPILVNDTLSNGLEYVNSNANAGAGSYNSGTGLWNITAGLNRGDTATLDITCKVKTAGNLSNHAFLVLDDYNNSLTNDSSVNITAIDPSSGDGNDTNMNGTDGGMDGNDTNTNGGGMDEDTNGFDQTFFKSLTGFPLILLVLLCVLGFVYYRRK